MDNFPKLRKQYHLIKQRLPSSEEINEAYIYKDVRKTFLCLLNKPDVNMSMLVLKKNVKDLQTRKPLPYWGSVECKFMNVF